MALIATIRTLNCCSKNILSRNLAFSLTHRAMSSSSDSKVPPRKSGGFGKIVLGGILVGSAYAFGKHKYDENALKNRLFTRPKGQQASALDYLVTDDVPEFKVARQIRNPADSSKLKITLYQYQTCPFCCKARAFLDYFGLNYDVIEVNSVTRKQMKWSTKYKKVPVLVAELENGKKFQLVDSTALISTLFSFLYDKPKGGLEEMLNCYPQIWSNEDKKPSLEIMNR